MVSALWTAALLSLAAVAGCAWLVVLMLECGVHPVRDFVGFLRSQPKAGRVFIGAFFAALWMIAGAKPGTGASTAEKGEAESLPLQGSGDDAKLGTEAKSGDISPERKRATKWSQEGCALAVAGGTPASNGPKASDGGISPERERATKWSQEGCAVATPDAGHVATPPSVATPSRPLGDEDFARGFVLTRVGTGETFDFSAPSNAAVCADWEATGAATDWIYLAPAGWSMRIGDATASRLRVHSDGWVEALPDSSENSGTSTAEKGEAESFPLQGSGDGAGGVAAARCGDISPERKRATKWSQEGCALAVADGKSVSNGPMASDGGISPERERATKWSQEGCAVATPPSVATPRHAVFAPFRAALGLAPEANWPRLPASARPSHLWHLLTPSNTLVATWRNALLGRSPSAPVSFQLELGQGGSADFRYGLSAVPEGAALPDASACGASAPLGRQVTSLGFASALDLRCVRCLDAFRARLGGLDPLSCPPGSTNTVWEHIVYSGTADGAFTLPEPTDSSAVMRISVAGSGEGVLDVGGAPVPLVGGAAPAASAASASPMRAPAAPPPALLVGVPRGRTVPLYLRGDGSLTVSLTSGDFAFGVLPDPAGGTLTGWVCFPPSSPTPACIHDYSSRRVTVTLPAGAGSEGLRCSWSGASGVEARNVPPRSATLVASFSPRGEGHVSYTLSHPLHLFGAASGTQRVRFCPVPPEPDPDRPDPYDPPDPPSPDDPDNPDDPDDGDEEEDDEPDEPDPSGTEEEGPDVGGEGGGPDPAPPCRCDRAACDGSCGCCSYPCCGFVDPDSYDEVRTNLVRMSGVLLVRDPPLFGPPIRLEVLDGDPGCCPCLDHARRWVGLVLCRGLEVLGPDGTAFTRSAETVDVRIAASGPSRVPGDAFAAFATNGAVTLECSHTALGVGIASPAADLDALAALSPPFGLPIPVCTNAEGAAALTLSTDVLLGGMSVHLGFEGADAPFALWVRGRGGWRRVASSDGGALDLTLPAWRSLAGARPGDGALRTEVRVTAAAPGSATLVFRAWGAVGGRFVEDEARRRITAVAPTLRADIDHDGRLGAPDDACRLAGSPFRFWFNEDREKGDHAGQSGDLSPNAADLKVNGKLDLVNLFPVAVDASPFVRAWGGAAEVRLRADSDSLRYCVLGEGLTADSVRGLASSPVLAADGTPLESAELTPLGSDGVPLGELADAAQGPVLLAFEAAGPVGVHEGPELVVSLGGAEVYRERLHVAIDSVDGMYRHLGLRGAEAGGAFAPALPGEPWNLPDAETDGRHFVFVHGYGVTAAESRQWARAMFKRLWWAGSRSMFTAVDWRGDDSRIHVPVLGGVSPDYYVNVRHAFMAAAALKAACGGLPGRKTMLAHSLGNVAVSAAAVDHGLAYGRYYMLNAAVPMEAYDRHAGNDLMVDGAWKDMDARFRASRFSSLFDSETYRDDFRRSLSWKGRFAGIRNAVNCYSPTEDVLANPAHRKMFGMTVGETTGGIWSKQELFKGCAVWYGLNAVTFSGAAIEGGWGINARYVANPFAYVPLIGLSADYFANCTREDLIRSPLFTSFDDVRMSSTNALNIVDYGLRAKMLGDAIPAESFAAGANATEGVGENVNLQDFASDDWPRWKDGRPRWLHSDIKDISYFYTSGLFRLIQEGGP